MTRDEIIKAVEIIQENILTPVIFMYEDEAVEFICFCEDFIEEDVFYETERILKTDLGINAEIVDICNFDEFERIEILNHSALIFSEGPHFLSAFEEAINEDAAHRVRQNAEIIRRRQETGSYYYH